MVRAPHQSFTETFTGKCVSESREATMPFYPEKKVPLDAYNAAILEHVTVSLNI